MTVRCKYKAQHKVNERERGGRAADLGVKCASPHCESPGEVFGLDRERADAAGRLRYCGCCDRAYSTSSADYDVLCKACNMAGTRVPAAYRHHAKPPVVDRERHPGLRDRETGEHSGSDALAEYRRRVNAARKAQGRPPAYREDRKRRGQ